MTYDELTQEQQAAFDADKAAAKFPNLTYSEQSQFCRQNAAYWKRLSRITDKLDRGVIEFTATESDDDATLATAAKAARQSMKDERNNKPDVTEFYLLENHQPGGE